MKKRIAYFSFIFIGLAAARCSAENSYSVKDVKEELEMLHERESKIVKANPKTAPTKYAHAWVGQLDGRIPVFFHYTIKDSILSGEVTYLNTKSRTPIRILGEILPNNFYHILEFDKKAMITGIWSLTITNNSCTGKWYAPSNSGWYDANKNKEFDVKAHKSDSLIKEWNLNPDPNHVFGDYAYSYTKENGNVGDFTLEKLTDNKANFRIIGVASAPGFNIASIEETTIDFVGGKNTAFDFVIPESKQCDFKVKFYKDFAHVYYTKGYCQDGYFGHNATIEGLFLKLKKN